MKKAIMFGGLLLTLLITAFVIDLPGQLLSFFFVGLIPYTDVSVPALLMLFIWLLLPVILFGGVNLFRGLFLLVLIIAEQIEYGVKAHIDTAAHNKKPNIFKQLTARAEEVKAGILAASKSMQKKFKHLPKLRYRKITDLNEA